MSVIHFDWVESRLSQYIDPVRKGINKGEKIGMCRKKYECCLHLLLEQSPTKLSAIIGSSRSVIAKWKTEQQVKDMVVFETNKFIDYFIFNLHKYDSGTSHCIELYEMYKPIRKRIIIDLCKLQSNITDVLYGYHLID